MLADRMKAVTLAAVLAAVLVPGRARAALWTNHVDASMINEIVVRGNVLYMATFGGLMLYDVGTGAFQQYDNGAGLPSNSLNCLTFNAAGDIYVGTDDIGVAKVRLSNGHLKLLRSLSEQIDGLSGSRVNSIALWGDEVVYGASPGAGTIRKDFAGARYYMRDGLPSDAVLDVLPVGDVVWLATDGGVAVLDRLGLITVPPGGPAESNVLGTDGATIWVGTDNGVRRYDPGDGSWTDIGPAARQMYSFEWDGTRMWSGSTRNLFQYTGSGQNWTPFRVDTLTVRYAFSSGTNAVHLRGLALMPGGNVYMGGAQPGDLRGPNLMRYDGTRVDNLFPNGPGGNTVLRMALDVDGSLWASFASFYVGRLTTAGQWINYNSAIPGVQLPTNPYANLTCLVDRDGHKWFCTLSSETTPKPLDELDDRGDADYSNDVWTRHTIGSGGGDGLGSLRLQRALLDPDGNRWFLSDVSTSEAPNWSGIQILRRDKSQWLQVTPTTEPQMISGNIIDVAFGGTFAYVAHRRAGVQLWGHGGYDWTNLSTLTGDVWDTRVSLPGDLPSIADVNGIELRSDGVLWIATSAGLFRYQRGASPKETTEIPVYIGIGPGILSSQVNDILLDRQENLWVATSLGLNRIAREDDNDIQTFTTAAGFVTLSTLRYPLSVISPLVHADCRSLAIHPTRDVLYIGTQGGLSVYDFSASDVFETDLSRVYVYPNPVYGSRGQNALKIENIDGPVTIEIYNLEGELVHSQSADSPGQVIWDLTDKSGFVVGSGNYIVRIVGTGASVNRPFAVIR